MSKEENLAGITRKIRIQGKLKLLSPLLIGAGVASHAYQNEVDTYVLRDKAGKPFIPGTSLTGALRNFLHDAEPALETVFFGCIQSGEGKTGGSQSLLNIADVPLHNTKIILRDGVRIDEFTGTAVDGAKYNYEAVERGASGDFAICVNLRQTHEPIYSQIEKALYTLMDYICTGFKLGAVTAKGFGMVQGREMKIAIYDFHKKEDVKSWLLEKNTAKTYKANAAVVNTQSFIVDADFSLRSSLIVRDYTVNEETADGKTIHAVQKKSGEDFVIPGTSLKGVLRHQAARILRFLGKSDLLLKHLMGYAEDDLHKRKSRFLVQEAYFKTGVIAKEQSRNRIDRFTGGTIDTALFTTKPVWQQKKGEKTLHLHYEIQHCAPWEAGLALFLLRDLWQGDVAIGGEKSIGRGTLQGIEAKISYKEQEYILGTNGKVVQGDANHLEAYARALHEVQDKEVSA